jgi:hypothetical protein
MIMTLAHLLACLALIAAVIYRIMKFGTAPNAYRFLFPFISAAALAGMIDFYRLCMEFFVAWYSGARYQLEAMEYRLTGPYGWVYVSRALAPGLPVAALIPWIGKRPCVVAVLALAAATATSLIHFWS